MRGIRVANGNGTPGAVRIGLVRIAVEEGSVGRVEYHRIAAVPSCETDRGHTAAVRFAGHIAARVGGGAVHEGTDSSKVASARASPSELT